jgi:hypothetical protein
MPDYLDPLSGWPCPPPPGYRGQLAPDFQRRRADFYAGVDRGECNWYHTSQLPDGTVLEGEWDLRGREHHYLGDVPLANRTVLEFGPASGYLTFWMESQGADVTAFEAGYDAAIHLVPSPAGGDVSAAERALMEHTRRTTNAWWYLHREYQSKARLVHGDIYHLPDDLGQYDLVVLGSILLHLRDPFSALQQAAHHASDTIVVTDTVNPGLEGDVPLLRFWPDVADLGPAVGWWQFSPGTISAMLWRLGFERERVVRHNQRYRVQGHGWSETAMYSVVARRMSSPPASPPGWLMRSLRTSRTTHWLRRLRTVTRRFQ